MTREEASKIIKDGIEDMSLDFADEEQYEALNMAIKALEQEPSGEIVKTKESNDNGTKYLNINVSDDEVKRNPDIVRLCSDVGILEYAKPQTGHWITKQNEVFKYYCDKCGTGDNLRTNYCPNCGCRMVEPQESDDCRNCKKWEDCPCGKEGHESGTSQGYSIGKCKDFEPQESEDAE